MNTDRNARTEIGRPVAISAVALLSGGVLRQAIGYLALLSDAHYTARSTVLPSGTIGKHMRHLLDHFAAALFVDASRTIDYDRRARETIEETSRGAAIARAHECIAVLTKVNVADEHAEVTVRIMLAADGTEAALKSTLARELAFAAHHAEHHLAMMAAIGRELGVAAPADLGKAPSTLNFEKGRTSP